MKQFSFYVLTLTSLLFLLTACGGTGKSFWIDNPTSSPITVTIDNDSYEIPANSGVSVDIASGKHTLSYNGQTINMVVKPNDQECVINPTLSNYVFFNNLYVVEGREEKAQSEYDNKIESYTYPLALANNDTIMVPFKLIENTLFIERYNYYWHFGVTEDYKDITEDMSKTNQSTLNRAKIFRENDFYKYIGKENLPEGFVIKPSTMKLSDLPAYEFIPSEVIDLCPAIKDDLISLKAKFESLETMTDAKEFEALTSYKLSNELGEVWNKALEVKPEDNSECDTAIRLLTKHKPSFGEMNAYIVK